MSIQQHVRHLILVVTLMIPVGVHAEENTTPQLRGFGVCTHLSRRHVGWKVEHLLPLMKQLGVSVIRDEVSWGLVEQERGVYAIPEREEEWLNAVMNADIKVIVVLDYGNELYDNELDPDAFARYAAWMASRFKGDSRVRAFEIWNEPMNFGFRAQYGGMWNGKDDAPWLEKFSELVAKASAAIRREDSERLIITGYGVAPASVYAMQRYPRTWDNVDGLTDHPYTYRTPPERVPWGGAENRQRDGISVADDDQSMISLFKHQQAYAEEYLNRELPLWVTEFGYSTYYRAGDGEIYAGFSEQAQAAYHVRALVQAMGFGVEAWCIYDLMDDNVLPTHDEANFGLVLHEDRGYEPKAAFHAIRRLAERLGPDWLHLEKAPAALELYEAVNEPVLNHLEEDVTPQPHIYWFQTPEQTVAILWMSGQYQGEFTPRLAELTWSEATPQTPVAAINLVTGRSISLSTVTDVNRLSVRDIPVGSEPIAIAYPRNQ